MPNTPFLGPFPHSWFLSIHLFFIPLSLSIYIYSLSLPPKRKVLALLNPFGGRGLAPRKWEKAKEILNLCYIDVTLKHTERAMHAFEITNKEI